MRVLGSTASCTRSISRPFSALLGRLPNNGGVQRSEVALNQIALLRQQFHGDEENRGRKGKADGAGARGLGYGHEVVFKPTRRRPNCGVCATRWPPASSM